MSVSEGSSPPVNPPPQMENLERFMANTQRMDTLRDPFEYLFRELRALSYEMSSLKKSGNYAPDALVVKETKHLVNQAEDALDSFISFVLMLQISNPCSIQRLVQVQRPDHDQGFDSLITVVRKIMEHTLRFKQIVQGEMEAIEKRQQVEYDGMTNIEHSEASHYPDKALIAAEDLVVGFDDAAKDVIQLLTGASNHLEIIPIFGRNGLGKTTLAKKVLDDPNIVYQFGVRAFVPVSGSQARDVFITILRTLTPDTDLLVEMTEVELATRVRQCLKGNKYLIVLDDIRERKDWDAIKAGLSNNKKGSRVLITTSQRHVAAYVNPVRKPYSLRRLGLQETVELLHRKVFGEYRSISRVILQYVVFMANKCEGLPLAILLIAGYLMNNREKVGWWSRLAKNMNDFVFKDEHHGDQDLLNWSYYHLPDNLKLCFLYLGIFPVGFEIPVSELVRLWIAEGFIPQEDKLPLEDVAQDYLEELVYRNLLIVAQRKLDGRIKTCRIYETIGDFCRKKALEEDLFQEIEAASAADISSSSDHNRWRRICINPDIVSDYISKKPFNPTVRSFLTFTKKETKLIRQQMYSAWKSFRLLKVMDLRAFILTHHFPLELCELVLLKYIAIRCVFSIIPSEMSSLRNLQTLILESTKPGIVFEIRANLWKMTQLRHFYTNVAARLRIQGTENARHENLQTLTLISPETCRQVIFKNAPFLRKLGIRGNLALLLEDKKNFGDLNHLHCLEKLQLFNHGTNGGLNSFPQPGNLPGNIRKLSLLNTSLPWNQMSVLAKLDQLEVLKLKDHAFMGEVWKTESGGFRKLQVLHIGGTNLQHWKASGDHFPVLKCLLLKHCADLQGIPEIMADIRSLRIIDLYFTNPQVAASAKKIQQQHDGGISSGKIKLSIIPPEN